MFMDTTEGRNLRWGYMYLRYSTGENGGWLLTHHKTHPTNEEVDFYDTVPDIMDALSKNYPDLKVRKDCHCPTGTPSDYFVPVSINVIHDWVFTNPRQDLNWEDADIRFEVKCTKNGKDGKYLLFGTFSAKCSTRKVFGSYVDTLRQDGCFDLPVSSYVINYAMITMGSSHPVCFFDQCPFEVVDTNTYDDKWYVGSDSDEEIK